tara:strand:+ start:1210 stop:2493 length:1284 start_codon:yes stop_codon:yes gene_type:complete
MTVAPQNLIYILFASAFGPYIISGIRLDQFMVYLLLLLLIMIGRIRIVNDRSLLAILMLAGFIFTVPLISTVTKFEYISLTLLVSQIENYLTPIIVLVLLSSLLAKKTEIETNEIFMNCIKVFLTLLSLNTLFSIYLFISGDEAMLSLFTGSREITMRDDYDAGATAASIALGAGRITGVFTQVFEAGTAYSMGIVSIGYLHKKEPEKIMRNLTCFLFILIGGMLTFSKIFFIIGFLAFIYFIGLFRSIKMLLFMVPLFVIILSYFPDFEIAGIAFGKGLKNIFRLFDFNSGNFIAVFTSGRFSDESSIITGMESIFYQSPIIGLGYGSIETSDFSLYEVFSLGGILGMIAYIAMFGFLITLSFIQKDLTARDFLLAINFIILFSSLGGPIITANRISVIFWVLVGIIILKERSSEHIKLTNKSQII